MSSSDDELTDRTKGQDPTPGREGQGPKKTLLGLGFKLPSPTSLPPARPAPIEDEDFEAEATQMADNLVGTLLEDIDAEMDAAFGLDPLPEIPIEGAVPAEPAPEEEFSAEKTQLAPGLRFPEDEVDPEPQSELGGLQSDSLPMPIRRDGAPADAGLHEDSLPEPVRTQNSTLASAPDAPRSDWRASVPASLLSSQAPLPDGDELPAPIREEPSAFKGTGRGEEGVEFETEKTELINSPFEQDPSVAKLVTLDGPVVGQEFFATGLRNTIGRGLNNSIVVGDPAMSRQHFEITKNLDESFTLRDLQSVNGTMLNGTRIREADLYHGDRVEAGKSTFQFMVTGNPPAASRQRRLIPAATSTMAGPMPSPVPVATARPASNHRLVIALSLAALVVSVLIVAGLALVIANREDAAPVAAAPSASQIYLLGVEAVKARDWDLAETHFTAAAKADPTLAGIPEQLRRIELERAAAKDLALARALANAGRLEEAKEHVEAIGPQSVYHAEAQDVVRDTRTSEVERMYADAQAAFTDDDTTRASELVAEILDLVPTHQGAQKMRRRIEEAQLRAAEDERGDQDAVASRGGGDDFRFELVGSQKSKSSAPRPQRKRSGGSTGSARVPNFTRGFVLYRTRKFDEAQAFFAEAAAEDSPAAALAKKLAAQIAEFDAAYTSGNAAYAAKNWPEADRKLLAAKRADAAISSDAGQFHGELSTKLGTVKAQLGLAALKRNEPVDARRYLEQAESFDRDGAPTKQLRAALDKEARALYVQAVNLRKSDPPAAAKLCRTIMQIVPGSDETHQKANKLLKDL